jgi:hypothetical protein
VHSALQRKNASVEPGRREVTRQETCLLQLGNPRDLVIDVAVADSVFQGPLELVMGPYDFELGQIEEIGTILWRSDIEEGPLPVFAGLDDFWALVLVLRGEDQAASGVGHVDKLDWFTTFHSRRAGFPSLCVVGSEVKEPLPKCNTGTDPEVSLTECDEAGHDHDKIRS